MKSRRSIACLFVILLMIVMVPLSAFADTATVLASALYLREDPASGASAIGLYRYGTRVTVLNTTRYRNWYQVRTPDGKTGYMYKSYLSSVSSGGSASSSSSSSSSRSSTTTMYIYSSNGGSVNMRSKASTSSKLVDRLLVGTKVTVLSKGTYWSEIKYGSKTGYVRTVYLTSTKPSNLPTSSRATVTSSNGSGVHMRKTASTSSRVVDTLSVGTRVTVLQWGSVWTQVRYGSKTGYIMTRYLTTK